MAQASFSVGTVIAIVSAVVGGLAAYYVREINDAAHNANIAARLGIIESELLEQRRWIDITTENRFRDSDAEKLRRELLSKIENHELQSAHGIVNERLSRIETILHLRDDSYPQ